MRTSENDEYERRREERRQEERRYEADVAYEVWRSGGDVDRIDRDRVHDAIADGLGSSEAARREMNRQRLRAEALVEAEREPCDDEDPEC